MPQIHPDVESFASIKVVGVGGSGGNAIDHMVACGIRGIDFIAVNTDAQDLHHSKAHLKIHIGKNITRGLGAGMDPEVGRRAAEENKDDLAKALEGADMVFVTCGLGGGTGTGASPIVADLAKSMGILTVAGVTKPFSFEGVQRAQIAREGLEELQSKVDTIITIPNDRLLNVIEKKTTFKQAFAVVDDVLRQAVQGISDLVTLPGIINVDFADVRAIMQDAGSALMGIGLASGEERAINAAKGAINSPLLELSIDGARGVLFNIAGTEDITMAEVSQAAKIITDSIDPEAKVIFGVIEDEQMKKGDFKVTVIATGFDNAFAKQNRVKEVREIFRARATLKPVSASAPEPAAMPRIRSEIAAREDVTEETTIGEIMRRDRETQDKSPRMSRSAQDMGFEMSSREIADNEKAAQEEFDIPAFIRKKLR